MLQTIRRLISYPQPDRTDQPDIPLHIKNLALAADVAVLYNQGTDAQRQAASHQSQGGHFWWTTDTHALWYDDGSSWYNLTPAVPQGTPSGAIMAYGGNVAPSGFLLCDGASYLRATYPNLVAAIGTAYGAADGTHFNVPDIRGRVPVGFATSGGHADVSALGGSDGSALGSRRPKHKHSVQQPTISTPGVNVVDPGHTHLIARGSDSLTPGGTAYSFFKPGGPTTDSGTENHNAGVSASLSGAPVATGGTVGPQTGAEPTDSEAYLVVNYIIAT